MKPFYEIRTQPALFCGPVCDWPYAMHMHGAVEIVHLKSGSLTISVNTHPYRLVPGDTLVIFPTMPHSYDEISPDMDGLCVIFMPEKIQEFTQTFRTMRPVSPLLPSDRLTSGVKEAVDMLISRSKEIDSPFIECWVHVYLAHLMMLLEMQPLEKFVDDSLVQKVIQYVADHFEEDLTLDSVAQELFISRSHLSHIFSEQLTVSFRKYINMLRIDKAVNLLRSTEMSITEIGYACGYNNPRTFHRAFLEETGQKPAELRTPKTPKPQ